MTQPADVTIVEVAPRDGLQNEDRHLDANVKIELIERLAETGLTFIEAGSFVSPTWVPQMATTGDVLQRLHRAPGVRYPVLVPNMEGLQAAMAAGVEDIAIFGSASESFSKKNINCSIDESFINFADVSRVARAEGIRLRGYISCVLGCPYEGEITPDRVREFAMRLVDLGCYEISLGDTIGVGTPHTAAALIDAVTRSVPIEQVAVHFHDTYGQALANIYAVLQSGIRVIDSSVAGLGGCPYAKGAPGNVATEDVVYMLDGMGIETGVDLARLVDIAQFISTALGRRPLSKVANAYPPPA
ncbi:MAG: hydroxymethylglutaryl-CoA lyase [Gammaproteobacteria bacterium]|nr:hydroxymethylglutaryl-CoA lyase [Gammaproteobacteria bacterium]